MSGKKSEDERGVLYKKVKKNPIRVKVIMIDGTKVQGCFHQPLSTRLTDMLNSHASDTPFLAVTDAQVELTTGEHLHYKFFTLNRAMIVCCFPLEDEVAVL